MNKRRNKRKQQKVAKRMIILLGTVFMITLGSIVFGSSFSSAHENNSKDTVTYKYYKSIEIQKGESLWSIANDYKSSEETTQDYIKELRKLNSLYTDTIHEGQNLIVVYYDTEYR